MNQRSFRIFLLLMIPAVLFSANCKTADSGKSNKENDVREESVDVFKNACNAGDAGECLNLGVSYERGVCVAKDLKKAEEMYQKACDMKYKDGCEKLGKIKGD